MKSTYCVTIARAALLMSLLVLYQPTLAATGSAQGDGASANLTLVPLLGTGVVVNIPPTPLASVNSTGSDHETDVGISAGLTGVGTILSTGLLTGTAQATLAGYSTDNVSASGEVDNAVVSLKLLTVTVLGVTADVLQGNAQAICSSGQPAITGNSVITNLQVVVLGVPISIPVTLPPNTTIAPLQPLTGLSIVVNQQIPQTNGLTVHALHVILNNYLLNLIGNVSVDIALGNAVVTMQSACAVPPAPHLTLTKTANGSFVRGSTGSYTLTASNSGTAATSGTLTISDTLPTGLSYSSASGTGWSCSASGQVVTCTNAAALGIGASTQVTITVAIASNAPSTVTNNAVVGSPNDPAPSCTTLVDGCATNTTPVNDAPAPHLTLTKTANGSFVRGSTGSYTLTASNSGTAATSGTLTISDTLPTGLSYSSASGTGWSCSASGQVVTCTNAAALGIGASSQVTITVAIAVNAPSPETNNAVVGSTNDPPPSCTTPGRWLCNDHHPGQRSVAAAPDPDEDGEWQFRTRQHGQLHVDGEQQRHGRNEWHADDQRYVANRAELQQCERYGVELQCKRTGGDVHERGSAGDRCLDAGDDHGGDRVQCAEHGNEQCSGGQPERPGAELYHAGGRLRDEHDAGQ